MLLPQQIAKFYATNVPALAFTQAADEYHASAGVSRSQLWPMRTTPADFAHKFLNNTFESDAMQIGTLLHRRVLENKGVPDNWEIKPEGMKFNTKEGRTWKEEHPAEAYIDTADVIRVDAMAESIRSTETGRKLLENARTEVSCFGLHKDTGLMRRCRVDLIPAKADMLVDLKKVKAGASIPAKFARHAEEYGYWYQAGFYGTVALAAGVLNRPHFGFIVVEDEPPYKVSFPYYTASDLDGARHAIEEDLQKLHECCQSNKWPGLKDEITAIFRPAWATT